MMTNLAVALAWLLYQEAANQPREGQRMVCDVIWNRAVIKQGDVFNDLDLWYTITQRAQFSAVPDILRKPAGHMPPDDEAWRYCFKLASVMVGCAASGDTKSWKVKGPWTCYYNPKTAPWKPWMAKLIHIVDVADHRFGEEVFN